MMPAFCRNAQMQQISSARQTAKWQEIICTHDTWHHFGPRTSSLHPLEEVHGKTEQEDI